jgi:alkylation response protein AidB-like acyl-CoA dehydrogenase
MEFGWTEADLAYRAEIKAFLGEQLPVGWSGYDKSDLPAYKESARAFCHAMAERGWLTQNWPREYGGQEASPWRAMILNEELWPIGEPRGAQYMNVTWIGPAIMAAGSEDQKLYHLGRISAGDVFWCQGFSEPDAGSDLPALRTRAVRDGDDYIVNGTKIWTSHVGTADFCFLLVKTDAEASKRNAITILLTPMDTPGIEVRHIDGFVGEQAFHQLVFENVRVPAACRLGGENQGWDIVRKALSFERVGLAHYDTAREVLMDTVREAKRTGAINDPEIQSRIGDVHAAIEAARLLTYRVVDLRANGAPPTADANISRVAQTQALRQAGELAQLVFGEEGLVAGSNGDIRRVLAFGVAAGTTEMQLDQIASNFLDLPKFKSQGAA